MEKLIKNISQQLRKALDEKAMSLSDLSESSNVTEQVLNDILSGQNSPSFEEVIQIAKAKKMSA